MKRLKGFTLVELVIVIAIVIILSVVSIPIYRGYTRNAKMSEGYALLGLILSAEKTYFSQYGRFLHSRNSSAGDEYFTCREEVLGIDARGNKYFTCFAVDYGDSASTKTDWYIFAHVVIPEELRNFNNKSCLSLEYDITANTGASFSEQKR